MQYPDWVKPEVHSIIQSMQSDAELIGNQRGVDATQKIAASQSKQAKNLWNGVARVLPDSPGNAQRWLCYCVARAFPNAKANYMNKSDARVWREKLEKSLYSTIDLIEKRPPNLRRVTQRASTLFLKEVQDICLMKSPLRKGAHEETRALAHNLMDVLEHDFSTALWALQRAVQDEALTYDPLTFNSKVTGHHANKSAFVRALSADFKRMTGEWRGSWVAAATCLAFGIDFEYFTHGQVKRTRQGIADVGKPSRRELMMLGRI